MRRGSNAVSIFPAVELYNLVVDTIPQMGVQAVRFRGMTLIEPYSTSTGSVSGLKFSKSLLPRDSRLQFLATKVILPRCAGLIERPRLFEKISQFRSKRLVLIKAPAGFGKTSLATAWAERLRRNGDTVAWLNIDPDDDEPQRFLFYIAQALHNACEDVGRGAIDLISESSLIASHAIISSLINDLIDEEDEVYLFLENYNWVTDPAIHEALAYFLRHAPSHCHVVLTTRGEPSLPLASLRAENLLLEIDASALRFDLKETHDFLQRERPGILDPTDVKLLLEKTEGWPAALRIVASTSLQLGQDFRQYVLGLSGTQRTIGAYLAELLDGLPTEIAQFMLYTAVLHQLTGPLCDAVTESTTGQEFLESIEKRQLLLVSLDHAGQWYRFHTLLADYLRQRLKTDRAADIPGLHRRAATWYASNELWTDAVQHAIAAGDDDQAAEWIKNCAMNLVKKGDLFTLLSWQHLFPNRLMRGQLEVRLAIAWGLALALRFDDALQLLEEVERDVSDKRSEDAPALSCECQVIRSVAIALKDDSAAALELAEDCLDRSSDPWTTNVASNVVRLGYLKMGDLRKFYATPWVPFSLEEDRRNVFASVYRFCLQGLAEAQQLNLDAANRNYIQALRHAEQYVGANSVAASLPLSLIARLRYEQGQLDQAEAMLIDRLPIINAATMLECVWSAHFVVARVAVCRGNFARAYALLEAAENQGITQGWGRLTAASISERARLYFAEGRTSEGAACFDRLDRLAAEYPTSMPCARSEIYWHAQLVRAYLLSEQKNYEEAKSILKNLQHELERVHNNLFALRVAIHIAGVSQDAKQPDEAIDDFLRVLSASAKAGIYQMILDEGLKIGPLLTIVHESIERTGKFRELTPCLNGLIAGWRLRYHSQVDPADKSATAELISAREADILKLIARGLSNKEIARTLAIAPETVKSHVKHIFVKMGVEKRAQAVARAQSLGLVTTR
ncbi:MAG TPA: LuxR C-terminal-related transcriptional regulator [Pseudolabrys sp.]|nr:LuxR C-terminal-related transcriptional regulator [Pseudolabrys sp.]